MPNPPNAPPCWLAPGITISMFVPMEANRLWTRAVRAVADGDHGDHGEDADDDAQHGEKRPHLVAQQRLQRDVHRVPEVHDRFPASGCASASSSSKSSALRGTVQRRRTEFARLSGRCGARRIRRCPVRE